MPLDSLTAAMICCSLIPRTVDVAVRGLLLLGLPVLPLVRPVLGLVVVMLSSRGVGYDVEAAVREVDNRLLLAILMNVLELLLLYEVLALR